jgi:hypothetical protein
MLPTVFAEPLSWRLQGRRRGPVAGVPPPRPGTVSTPLSSACRVATEAPSTVSFSMIRSNRPTPLVSSYWRSKSAPDRSSPGPLIPGVLRGDRPATKPAGRKFSGASVGKQDLGDRRRVQPSGARVTIGRCETTEWGRSRHLGRDAGLRADLCGLPQPRLGDLVGRCVAEITTGEISCGD